MRDFIKMCTMVLHAPPSGGPGPPIIPKCPPRKNLGGPRPPLTFFKGGGGASSNIRKYQFSKKNRPRWAIEPNFNSQFKNNSPAAGYYAITPFSENNMVTTVK